MFCHVAVFLPICGESGYVQCSFCSFLQAQYQDDISFLLTFISTIRMDWKTVQVSTVYGERVIRLSRFADHMKRPTAELQSAAKSHFKTSKSCHFTLLKMKRVGPFWECAIYIYLKINPLRFFVFFFAETLAASSAEHTLACPSSACARVAIKHAAMLEIEVLEILIAVSIYKNFDKLY